jgi:hypothetical protein
MFRHAFIDRLKGCGDIPVPIAESITGHGRNASEFANYGSVGYTLGQKKISHRKNLNLSFWFESAIRLGTQIA